MLLYSAEASSVLSLPCATTQKWDTTQCIDLPKHYMEAANGERVESALNPSEVCRVWDAGTDPIAVHVQPPEKVLVSDLIVTENELFNKIITVRRAQREAG